MRQYIILVAVPVDVICRAYAISGRRIYLGHCLEGPLGPAPASTGPLTLPHSSRLTHGFTEDMTNVYMVSIAVSITDNSLFHLHKCHNYHVDNSA